MLAERKATPEPAPEAGATWSMTLEGNPDAVRDGLRDLFSCELLSGLTEDSRGSVEIVVAEVLNNVVEHAYAQYTGKIDLRITRHPAFLAVKVADAGLPMPGGELPGSKLADVSDLPEGGFGWFLIRTLTQDLSYRRDGERNLLSLSIGVDNIP